jgi:hypothetical protein
MGTAGKRNGCPWRICRRSESSCCWRPDMKPWHLISVSAALLQQRNVPLHLVRFSNSSNKYFVGISVIISMRIKTKNNQMMSSWSSVHSQVWYIDAIIQFVEPPKGSLYLTHEFVLPRIEISRKGGEFTARSEMIGVKVCRRPVGFGGVGGEPARRLGLIGVDAARGCGETAATSCLLRPGRWDYRGGGGARWPNGLEIGGKWLLRHDFPRRQSPAFKNWGGPMRTIFWAVNCSLSLRDETVPALTGVNWSDPILLVQYVTFSRIWIEGNIGCYCVFKIYRIADFNRKQNELGPETKIVW